MRNRLVKTRPHSNNHKPGFSIHQDDENYIASASVSPTTKAAQAARLAAAAAVQSTTPTKLSAGPYRPQQQQSPRSTLTLASEGAINAANMSRTTTTGGLPGKALPPTPTTSSQLPTRMNSTIRPVMSFDDNRPRNSEDSSTDGTTMSYSHSTARNSAFSSSVNSNTSMSSSLSQNYTAAQQNGTLPKGGGGRLKHSMSAYSDGLSPMLELPSRMNSATSSLHITTEPPPGGGFGGGGLVHSATETHLPLNGGTANGNGAWDSTVGKAGLGKTGRVINKLVSDNEALKRDIQIERLRAEESKQAARLLEDKLERVVSEYESRLLEANVTKTLLARKERQVESLQSTVELERRRAVTAGERERTWKEEMEKAKSDAKTKVEEATNHAALMEGRYNAISSHWRDQGEEVKRSMTKMRTEIEDLLVERKKDDDRIGTLRELCEQQNENIRELRQQKDDIAGQFERYKAEQENALREIKSEAAGREREQERLLGEAREVLDKLRWALNVKQKVAWAE
ncbi:hypothetical protein B0H66DRAFT_539835 [Apodospora peruviana]|uniref:SWI5-dependent HO expression protein 3 n=1 Tax=Apodospora peruviana TaxID=516989 RepID=A0AAE0MFB5_9PEZI|nr:hypothetical protein B0H66DRAFT_539835 [Apodospora peruviana]